ncbi:MAG: ribonuclease H-like domain-containing protein [SAR202 cluster bacterium]|jgi:ribonuclease D|nr:ribonuclease H-like domain-containing protein [SAR202 cluster bacterium]
MKIKLHKNDLPKNINFDKSVAIDTEAMGLNHARDRLCLVQLSGGNGVCHLVQIQKNEIKPKNLIKLLKNKKILKIFHFARFDVGILKHTFNINIENIYCTKIASKLTRTFTDKHGYKDLCKDLLNKEISKYQQTSDWGSNKLTHAQQQYAAFDVLYLHQIKDKLDKMLIRENRVKLSKACFDFIKIRTDLDLSGWLELDIFKH